MSKRLMMEAIGTFFLVLTVALTGNALAAAAALAVAIYMGGHISGGHFNPAVSFGMLFQGKLSASEFIQYVIAQMVGGIVAAGIGLMITGSRFVPGLAEGGAWWKGTVAEGIFTLLLVLTVLLVVLPKAVQGNQYFGLAIGMTVIAGGLSIGALTGGALNPAVGAAPLLFDIAHIGDTWKDLLMYIIGPMAGGALASVIYTMVEPGE